VNTAVVSHEPLADTRVVTCLATSSSNAPSLAGGW